MPFKYLIFLLPICASALTGYHLPWGKDAKLAQVASSHPEKEEEAYSLGVRVAEKVISFHQNVISPVDGPRSSFRPSSSAYMKQAMQIHGFWRGFLMGCDRLMRENGDPWVYRTVQSEGHLFKYDPVPPRGSLK